MVRGLLNAARVVSLVDRLMHRAEVVRVEDDSYRANEAEERLGARVKLPTGKPAAPRKAKP